MDDLTNNDKSVLRAEDILPPYNKSSTDQGQNPQTQIPQFNLAEQILAEQRKVTATRRKRSTQDPGQQTIDNRPMIKNSFESCVASLEPNRDPLQEQIIAEIVARDIRQLCYD
jgi:hypothetical protein